MSCAIPCIYYGGPKHRETSTVPLDKWGTVPLEMRVIAPSPMLFSRPEDVDWTAPVSREGRYELIEVRYKRPGETLFPERMVGEIIGVTYSWLGWIGEEVTSPSDTP